MNVVEKLAPYAKAVAAFVALLIPVLTSLGVLLTDIGNGVANAGDFTTLGVSIAALAAGTKAVHFVSNRTTKK